MWGFYKLRDTCFQMNNSACWPRMFLSRTLMRRQETSRGGEVHAHMHRLMCFCSSLPVPFIPSSHASLPTAFPRMPSSTRWCMTRSKRPFLPIKVRSESGTSSRRTLRISWRKVCYSWRNRSFLFLWSIFTVSTILTCCFCPFQRSGRHFPKNCASMSW